MAFDGTVIRALANELSQNLENGRISRIIQPEKDEIMLTIRGIGNDKRLLISANPSIPLICFVNENKAAPDNSPAFCMLLRKHILNGKIISVTQREFERAIKIEIEHLNEMGDMGKKYLIIEIMGKHSNIILVDDKDIILDGIKRITPEISSIRNVLPSEPYFIPNSNKLNPLKSDTDCIINSISKNNLPVFKVIYETISGFSPVLANEICYMSKIEPEKKASDLDNKETESLKKALNIIFNILKNNEFNPVIYYKNNTPRDFSAFPLSIFESINKINQPTISDAILNFYYEKAKHDRLKQQSSDLRQLINNLTAKSVNKLKIQEKQLSDTLKKDKYKLFGELLNAYLYDIKENTPYYEAMNYYDNNKTVKIPLDPTLSAAKNSVKYYNRYNKLKRTATAIDELIPATMQEIEYLNGISMYLEKLNSKDDISALKDDLIKNGFLNKKSLKKNNKKIKNTKLEPLHYITKNGRDIFVGRNNVQNDELSFKLANKNDWWFHAKNIAGSHVILRTGINEDIEDEDFETAARLAAFYSSSDNAKIEIDYTQRKNLIKPPASKSGYVIYHTNYSMLIDNDISGISLYNS